jgi:alanyl-tRNA synthetase
MTTRLYYTDASLVTFDATVTSCAAAGDRFEAVLDQTAFYPTSGGQPHDTGTLGAARVLDVVDREDGVIAHVIDAPVETGARVAGVIDWPRRFDHMQQHTGQHVLSAAFDRLFDVRTVSFHLGAEAATIDLAREMAAGDIAAAEAEANRVVWENRPVHVRFAGADEAARLPLRKESARTGELRLVEVPECDLSACGGTHVAATGAVGLIAVAGWERFKSGSRVSFVCGGRALRSHARLRDTVAATSRLLSAPPHEMAAAIERLQAEARQASRAVEALEQELSVHRAAALRAGAETIGGTRGVLTMLSGMSAGALKQLAAAIVAEPGLVAVLVGDGQPAPVAIARSADVSFDAGGWMKQAAQALGGRGGGRPEQAQGGIGASGEAILGFARSCLESQKKTIQ